MKTIIEFEKQLKGYLGDKCHTPPTYVVMSFKTLRWLCAEIDKSMNYYTKEKLGIMDKTGFIPKHWQTDPNKIVGYANLRIEINNSLSLNVFEFKFKEL